MTDTELWGRVEELQRRLQSIEMITRQTADAIHGYDLERDGQAPGALLFAIGLSEARRAELERDDLIREIREVVASYCMAWKPGWRVPPGYVECAGAAWWQGSSDGLHIRPYAQRFAECRDGRENIAEPELRDGEIAVWTMGTSLATIVRGITKDEQSRNEYPSSLRQSRFEP